MNGTMKLRRALPEDATAVRELTREAYSKWVPVIGREPLPMRADYDRAVRDHIVVLCEDGARLVALVELIAKDDHLLIENLAVRPGDQGKGLGALLLAHADVVARSLNLPEIRLFTNAAFATNLSFYGQRGYSEYRRGSMVPGSVTVFMRKMLESLG